MASRSDPPQPSRVDMHCHSSASQLSRLGVQRTLGLPECATPPAEVYALAKRRGMDFVTITDHDTIAGCLELAGRPDCFVSEELASAYASADVFLFASSTDTYGQVILEAAA